LEAVRHAVIGHASTVTTPYGVKTLVYGDYTASGRALEPIEDYIREKVHILWARGFPSSSSAKLHVHRLRIIRSLEMHPHIALFQVLPVYANTHTTTSYTGLQTTCFRLEARQMVAESVNARITYKDIHSDVVLFTGSGTTAAVNKVRLKHCFNLRRDCGHECRLYCFARLAVEIAGIQSVMPASSAARAYPWIARPFGRRRQALCCACRAPRTPLQHSPMARGPWLRGLSHS
jgi:hypothetical protein